MKIKMILDNLYGAIMRWIGELPDRKQRYLHDLNDFYLINQTLIPLRKSEEIDPKEIRDLYQSLFAIRDTSKNASTISLINAYLPPLTTYVAHFFPPAPRSSTPVRTDSTDSSKTLGYGSDEEKEALAHSASAFKRTVKRPVLEPSADPTPDPAPATSTLRRTDAIASINLQGLI